MITAEIITEKGTMKVEFYEKDAPKTEAGRFLLSHPFTQSLGIGWFGRRGKGTRMLRTVMGKFQKEFLPKKFRSVRKLLWKVRPKEKSEKINPRWEYGIFVGVPNEYAEG